MISLSTAGALARRAKRRARVEQVCHGVGAVALATLVGCGSGGDPLPTPCRSLPSATPEVVSVGHLRVGAESAAVAPGETVHFTVAAAGPLSYSNDCNQPVQLTITDHTGLSVDLSSGVSAAAGPCGQVTVAAGREADYSLSWTPDPTLVSDRYAVTLGVADQPAATLTISVRTQHGGCG